MFTFMVKTMADKHTPEMYTSHRKRLRESASSDGIASLENYKLIELYLFNLIPRIDVYPASHRLLDRFGSVDGIFSATEEELTEVFGIGEKSAATIRATGEVINRAVTEHFASCPLDSDARTSPLLSWLLRNSPIDTKLVISLKKDLTYLKHVIIGADDGGQKIKDFIKSEATLGAERFIFAHCHPDGYLKPTPDDLGATDSVASVCREAGGELTEHYIVTPSGAVGIIGSKDNGKR